MLTSNDVTTILKRLSGMLRTAVKSNSNGMIMSSNDSALNDMVIDTDGYTGIFPKEYIIRVSATGTPDSYRYSTDDGATWSVEASIATSRVTLSDGMGVAWAANTGHTLGTEWRFTACPSFAAERLREMIAAQSDIEVLYDMVSALYPIGKTPENGYTKIKTEVKSVITALAKALDVANMGTYVEAEGIEIPANLVDMGMMTAPAAQVVPEVTVLGEFVFSDVDTGIWTPRDTINTSKYNGGAIEIFPLTDITDAGSDGMSNVQGVDFDGAVVDNTTTFAFGGSLTQYTPVDISGTYTEKFKSISSITVTGGTAGEAFQIRTKAHVAPIL